MAPHVVKVIHPDGTVLYYHGNYNGHADINKAKLYWKKDAAEYRKKDLEWWHGVMKFAPAPEVEIVEVEVNIKETK